MIIGGQEFPEKCPENCPGKKEPFMQGGLCHRCPIFNCKSFIMEEHKVRLVEPEEYRSDWAKAWKEWFDKGMNGYPELFL